MLGLIFLTPDIPGSTFSQAQSHLASSTHDPNLHSTPNCVTESRNRSKMDAFYEQPPIIRTLTAAVFVTSCAAYASSSLLYQAYFDVNRTFFTIPPQIWRALTTFLVSGPKLGIIMDPYFCMLKTFNASLLMTIRSTACSLSHSIHIREATGDWLAALQKSW